MPQLGFRGILPKTPLPASENFAAPLPARHTKIAPKPFYQAAGANPFKKGPVLTSSASSPQSAPEDGYRPGKPWEPSCCYGCSHSCGTARWSHLPW
jgi:hypothetical protein